MEQGYLAQIQALIDQKLKEETPEERMERLEDEMKKEHPDLNLIKSLIEKGVGKSMTFKNVEKKLKQKERLNQIEAEIKKFNPDYSLIEELLEMGVGKKLTIEKIKQKREKAIGTKIEEFDAFMKSLYADGRGLISKLDMKKLKGFLKNENLPLNVDKPLQRGFCLVHVAVAMADSELARLLVKRGADLNTKGVDDVWRQPLDWENGGSFEVKIILREHGAEHEIKENKEE